MLRPELKRTKPVPMGPILYIDDEDPTFRLTYEQLKSYRRFFELRTRQMGAAKTQGSNDIRELRALASSFNHYCEMFCDRDFYEDDDTYNNKQLQNIQHWCQEPILFISDISKGVNDPYIDIRFGAFTIGAPFETRTYVYKARAEIEKVHAKLSPSAHGTDDVKWVTYSQLDPYYFRNIYAHIVPFLSGVIDYNVFAAKDLYDASKAIDVDMLITNHGRIANYLRTYYRVRGLSPDEIKAKVAELGYDKPIQLPKGAKYYAEKKASAKKATSSPVSDQGPISSSSNMPPISKKSRSKSHSAPATKAKASSTEKSAKSA